MSKSPFLTDLLRLPQARHLCIDASGLGMNLAEDDQSYVGCYKVEGVKPNDSEVQILDGNSCKSFQSASPYSSPSIELGAPTLRNIS